MSVVEHLEGRAIAAGAGVATGVCLPVAILAQLAAGDDADPSNLVFLFFLLILAGFALGGYVAARLAPLAPYSNGALAASATFVAIQGVAILVRLARDRDVNLATIPFNALVAYGSGLAGAALALWVTDRRRQARR